MPRKKRKKMIREEEVDKIGKLGKTHGVKGEISFLFDDDVFDRVDADYLILRVDGLLVPFFIEEYRFRSDANAIMKFEDIDTKLKSDREDIKSHTTQLNDHESRVSKLESGDMSLCQGMLALLKADPKLEKAEKAMSNFLITGEYVKEDWQ